MSRSNWDARNGIAGLRLPPRVGPRQPRPERRCARSDRTQSLQILQRVPKTACQSGTPTIANHRGTQHFVRSAAGPARGGKAVALWLVCLLYRVYYSRAVRSACSLQLIYIALSSHIVDQSLSTSGSSFVNSGTFEWLCGLVSTHHCPSGGSATSSLLPTAGASAISGGGSGTSRTASHCRGFAISSGGTATAAPLPIAGVSSACSGAGSTTTSPLPSAGGPPTASSPVLQQTVGLAHSSVYTVQHSVQFYRELPTGISTHHTRRIGYTPDDKKLLMDMCTMGDAHRIVLCCLSQGERAEDVQRQKTVHGRHPQEAEVQRLERSSTSLV